MATNAEAMSDKTFYGYMHPLQNRRYHLALVFSILLFPAIAVGLIAGTLVLIVPLVAFLLWVGMRVFFAYMLGNSILVSAENYPRIHAITEETKARLGYTKRIYVFVYETSSFNASMRHIFFRRAIFLNSELLQMGVSDSEVRWLVGRFVGYMRARQQAGVLGWIIRAAQHLVIFNLFIMPYERAMVYTGDRIALADIDGDLASAISAMQKLLVGRELGYSVNPQGLLAQHREVKGSVFAFLARAARAFPHTTARYVDLILFTKAFFPKQFAVFQTANPGLPEDLEKLGVSQQTESGTPRAAQAPKGWVTAGVTVTIPVVVGLLIWKIAYQPSYANLAQADTLESRAAEDPVVPPVLPPSPSAKVAKSQPIPPAAVTHPIEQEPMALTEDETLPPVGKGSMLSEDQLRYCLAQSVRVDAVRPLLDRHEREEVEQFNATVADFNARCATYRYEVTALDEAKAWLDEHRAQIEADARTSYIERFPRQVKGDEAAEEGGITAGTHG